MCPEEVIDTAQFKDPILYNVKRLSGILVRNLPELWSLSNDFFSYKVSSLFIYKSNSLQSYIFIGQNLNAHYTFPSIEKSNVILFSSRWKVLIKQHVIKQEMT